MTRPDYTGGGIVNLVQSLATACGSRNTPYPQLDSLPAEQIAAVRHVVLLIVDGLGQATLDRHRDSPNLHKHRIATLSSVFPSTTASAITTYMTGLAPAQHGLTGWHMHLEEIDQTLAILPLTPRGEPAKKLPQDLPPLLFDYPTLFQQLDRESWVVAPKHIAGSPFNAWHSRGASTLVYSTLPDMFAQAAGLLKEAKTPRYIYAYYPDLDADSHCFGTDSVRAQHTLEKFDTAFGAFIRDAQGSDAWVIVTADHGFIDSPADRVISLDDHPQLAALLARPLCGERRAAYCYVAPDNRPDFEAYVRKHLAQATDLYRSADLIRDGWFGPLPGHARLASRIGDYALVMKDNWTIKDWLPGEKHYSMLGVHGGVSAAEMHVPLIALRV